MEVELVMRESGEVGVLGLWNERTWLDLRKIKMIR